MDWRTILSNRPSGTVTFECKWIKCGKEGCKTCYNRVAGHGPYWYGYWSEGGKTKCKYIGKEEKMIEMERMIEQMNPTTNEREIDNLLASLREERIKTLRSKYEDEEDKIDASTWSQRRWKW